MRIDFSDSSPAAVPNIQESLLQSVLRQKQDLVTLEKILKADEKKEEKKEEPKGLSKKQVFYLMLCLSMPIGWITSTIIVMSILGMKANVDLLMKGLQ